MRFFFPAALLSLVLAAPAWADEATLEGYGGDGAVLVGVGGGDSPFADRAPAGGGNDGNLVVERAPQPTGGTQGGAAQPAPVEPAPVAPTDQPSDNNTTPSRPEADRRPAEGGREPQPERPAPAQEQPAQAPAEAPPVAEGAEASGGNSSGLPFTGTELVLLLAGFASLALMGLGMQRLAASQPRF